jgi:hypothetical protein
MVWAVSLSTMKLIPHCLTPALSTNGIQSLIDFGRLVGPLDHSVLYHRWKTREANPQTISGRTSYIRVRLAFHHYPQLIQSVFNRHWFGPSRGFTLAAACPWVDHSVSGVPHATKRPIQTRFRFGCGPAALTLLHTTTPRIILQKARCHTALLRSAPTACRHTASGIAIPLSGCFSPFPHGTCSLSVNWSV